MLEGVGCAEIPDKVLLGLPCAHSDLSGPPRPKGVVWILAQRGRSSTTGLRPLCRVYGRFWLEEDVPGGHIQGLEAPLGDNQGRRQLPLGRRRATAPGRGRVSWDFAVGMAAHNLARKAKRGHGFRSLLEAVERPSLRV